MIPKSTNPGRMKQNFEALDILLSDDEIDRINKLDRHQKKFDPGEWEMPEIGWNKTPIFA